VPVEPSRESPSRNHLGPEVGSQLHPLAEFAGMFKDDPMFEDWQRAIAEYRRKVDNDPDYL